MKQKPLSKDYLLGFARLALLMLGHVKWTRRDRDVFHRSTRKFYGRKR